MCRFKVVFLAMLIMSGCADHDPAGYVDPFIGTDFHGHTYPGATTPFGAVQLSPDTRRGNWDASSGYHYSDTTLYGFSHTHLSGTGAIDLGDILFHPTTLPLYHGQEGYIFKPHAFSHDDEEAYPGYYRVNLRDAGIVAELTATPRAGVHKYTFPASYESKIIVDLNHSLDDEEIHHLELAISGQDEVTGGRVTSGWTPDQHIYFVATFSRPFTNAYFVSDGRPVIGESSITGKNLQLVAEFETSAGEVIEVNVGTSLVSVKNARENLKTEAPVFDFDGYRRKAGDLWSETLQAISIDGVSKELKQIFYTAMYHTMVVPNVVSDVNGEYRTHNMEIKKLPGNRKMYSTLSLWDTFRAWHPLMTIINRQLTEDIIHSMLAMYEATGELPIWPLASGETGTMIGYHSVSVIADAYLKGIRDFDAEYALSAMKASSNSHRKGGKYYVEDGFIPANINKESVSCLLEYAYDDWCIAQMAGAMGHADVEAEYTRRARSYVNVFDGSTGFFRGKRSDGNWVTPFDPFVAGRDYTEANAWQYRFFVPHDVEGLISLLGSNEIFTNALDKLFDETREVITGIPDITGLIGQYAHGNEPSHHMAYLYSYAGQPWKTQEMVRKILSEMYSNKPDGISGNEDCGQMSAWYILSSLGFYPVSPGSGEYVLTTPLHPRAKIALHNGKVLEIRANRPDKNQYIQKVMLNGEPIHRNFITHDQLLGGGLLEYILVDTPDITKGVSPGDSPYSMTTSKMVSVPYTHQDLYYFTGEIFCELGCTTPGAEIRYTLDGTEPDELSALYQKPFTVDRDMTVMARAYKSEYEPSPLFKVNAIKAVFRKPDQKSASVNGVNFRYFEGEYASVYDIFSTPVVKSGTLAEPNIDIAGRDDDFGFEFTGLIYVPEEGIYDFYTESDDGSILLIGNETVVYNDGSHGAIQSTGRIPLKEGYHRFTLLYFEDYAGQKLEWGWKMPGSAKMEHILPANLFIR
jgi:predicted alpha-1,2-mannosidase